jgi:hypothetical protein
VPAIPSHHVFIRTLRADRVRRARACTFRPRTGIPDQIREVVDILQRAEIRERLAAANFRVLGSGPQASAARLAKDAATWREVIAKAGIKIE